MKATLTIHIATPEGDADPGKTLEQAIYLARVAAREAVKAQMPGVAMATSSSID